jgi:hypothetical protein
MPRLSSSLRYANEPVTAPSLLIALLLFCSVLSLSTTAQESSKRLTNADVISMASQGLSDDVIIAKIRSVSGSDGLNFDTSVEGLKSLKDAKVSDAVLKAMINPALPPTVVVSGAPMTADPNLPPPEVGVYWKDGPTFSLLQGKTLMQQKVGGRAGSFFTSGIRSEHWDAVVEGPTSANLVKDRRPAFYLYVRDGDTAADYVLLTLEKKNDHREFQVGSFGGFTGGKAGIKKEKQIPFRAEHAGVRIYKVTLDSDLKPGEYAFFLGTGAQSNMSGGGFGGSRSGGNATGKIYDFSIPQ